MGVVTSAVTSSCFFARRTVGVSIIFSGLFLLAIAFTHSLLLLVLLFFCLGFAAGQYFNAGMSTLRTIVHPVHWVKAISIHQLGPNVSFIGAPLLAGIVAPLLGWRTTAICMGSISIAAGIFFLVTAKGGHVKSPPVSFKGVGGLLRTASLWKLVGLFMLAISGEFAPFSVLSLFLIHDKGLSQETAGHLLALSRLATPICLLFCSRMAESLGIRRALSICFAGYALGMFLMTLPSFGLMLVGMFLQPVMTGMCFPFLFTLLAQEYSAEKQSLVLAIVMPMASFVGVGFAPFVLGWFGQYVSFEAGFLLLGTLAALTIAGSFAKQFVLRRK